MPRGKKTGGDRTGRDNYTVGYRKPPLHTRFRPGQSGNPAGRRKGVSNFKSDVKRTLEMPVKVKEGARVRQRSTQAGVLMLLREKALQGDARALDRLFEFASRYNNEPSAIGSAQDLAAEDEAILDAYVEECAALALETTTNEFPDDGELSEGTLSKKADHE